jgi:hypothetical protein
LTSQFYLQTYWMICCRHMKKCFCGTVSWCLLQIFQINWVSILHQAQVGINLHLVPSLGAFCRCDTCILLLFIIILMSIKEEEEEYLIDQIRTYKGHSNYNDWQYGIQTYNVHNNKEILIMSYNYISHQCNLFEYKYSFISSK